MPLLRDLDNPDKVRAYLGDAWVEGAKYSLVDDRLLGGRLAAGWELIEDDVRGAHDNFSLIMRRVAPPDTPGIPKDNGKLKASPSKKEVSLGRTK